MTVSVNEFKGKTNTLQSGIQNAETNISDVEDHYNEEERNLSL